MLLFFFHTYQINFCLLWNMGSGVYVIQVTRTGANYLLNRSSFWCIYVTVSVHRADLLLDC